MKKGAFLSFFLSLAILLAILPVASAQIIFNQLSSSLYNFGDSVSVSPTLLEDKPVNGIVKITMKCGDSNFLFYTSPVEITAGIEKKLDIPALKIAEDQKLLGNCYVESVLEDYSKNIIDKKNTENFKISNNITITAEMNKEEYLPGDKIIINGKAIKENGQEVDGNASINLDISFISEVKVGFFTQDILLDKKIKSGEHELSIKVIDKDNNVGTFSKKIEIKAIPSKVELQLNSESFSPGEKLETFLKVYDQADDEISTSGTLTLYDPDYIEIISRDVDTQTKFEYSFPSNSKPGKWELICFSSGVKTMKFIEINKILSISINLENDSLIIKNEGNAPYNDELKINFEKDGILNTITKQINLAVNGILTLSLKGDGVYNLKIEERNNTIHFSGITLTGGAAGIKGNFNFSYILAASFILLIIILFAISFIKRKKDRREKEIEIKKIELTQSQVEKAEEQ